jgi:hypothetical protein
MLRRADQGPPQLLPAPPSPDAPSPDAPSPDAPARRPRVPPPIPQSPQRLPHSHPHSGLALVLVAHLAW